MIAPHISRSWAWLAAITAGVSLAAGHAFAQSCVHDSAMATHCRFLLSEPRTFTVAAGAKLDPGASSPEVVIAVDGRPCEAPQLRRRRSVVKWCRLVLPSSEHVIVARVDPPTAGIREVDVLLFPNPRLAELPREARDLYPRKAGPLWMLRRFSPF